MASAARSAPGAAEASEARSAPSAENALGGALRSRAPCRELQLLTKDCKGADILANAFQAALVELYHLHGQLALFFEERCQNQVRVDLRRAISSEPRPTACPCSWASR